MFWEKGSQPNKANVFGLTIDSIENVPYHPNGASITIESLDLTYGSSFPLLNTIYMVMVSGLLLYTFTTIELQVETSRTLRAKRIWIISLSCHLIWTILALPWIDLGREFQIFNLISAFLIVSIVLFYPEGLILSKSQILATYHFYDKLTNLESKDERQSNISDIAVDHIIEYINSMPSEILDKTKKLEKNST